MELVEIWNPGEKKTEPATKFWSHLIKLKLKIATYLYYEKKNGRDEIASEDKCIFFQKQRCIMCFILRSNTNKHMSKHSLSLLVSLFLSLSLSLIHARTLTLILTTAHRGILRHTLTHKYTHTHTQTCSNAPKHACTQSHSSFSQQPHSHFQSNSDPTLSHSSQLKYFGERGRERERKRSSLWVSTQ